MGHGSKVKVNFGTLCIRPCGHDKTTVLVQSFSNFTCTLLMMRGGTLLILSKGSKVMVNFGTLCIRPCGHDKTTVLVQSFSNFTCKLLMMRGGTLLILSHGVKGHGQLWHSVYRPCEHDTDYSFSPTFFQTSHVHDILSWNVVCDFISIRPSSDGTYYGMVTSVRAYFCPSLYRTFLLQLWPTELKCDFVSMYCRSSSSVVHFAPIIIGVIPLFELRI